MVVAWQGWRIEVPEGWDPVQLDGDAEQGYLLLADLHRPRLGLRWKKAAGRKLDPQALVKQTMVNEVGVLAAQEASAPSKLTGQWAAPLLYTEKEPPGRDVWSAYSTASRRLLQVVCQVQQRDQVLVDKVLPTLSELPPEGPQEWSVFELSCRTPAGLHLVKPRLNAGDLTLIFEGKGNRAVTVRQIAVAKLALQRRPLERWIAEQASWRGHYYKTAGEAAELSASPRLLRQQIVRRRRFVWMWWQAPGFVAMARHDMERDRLVIVDATDESLAREVLDSVGWARAGAASKPQSPSETPEGQG